MDSIKISLFMLLAGASSLYSADNFQPTSTTITDVIIKTRVWRCACSSGCFNRLCKRWSSPAPESFSNEMAGRHQPEDRQQPSPLFTRRVHNSHSEARKRFSSNEIKARLAQRQSHASPTSIMTPVQSPVPPLDLSKITCTSASSNPLSELTDAQLPGEIA